MTTPKTIPRVSCQYSRVTVVVFMKASSNNRLEFFAVSIGTAFHGKTRLNRYWINNLSIPMNKHFHCIFFFNWNGN